MKKAGTIRYRLFYESFQVVRGVFCRVVGFLMPIQLALAGSF